MTTENSKTQQLKNSDEALTLTKWVEKVAKEKLNLKPE